MKAAKLLSPALLVTLSIFCFGPFLVFSSNRNEFLVSFASMAQFFILPAILLFLFLVLVPCLFGNRIFRLYAVLLFSLGFLLWVQSNFITWNYGPLNGQFIDWHRFHWRAAIDLAVWALTIAVFVACRAKLFPHISILSITLLALQLVSAAHIGYRQDLFTFEAVPDGIYRFSAKQNVIQIVLDGFQSDIFQEIVDGDPQWRSRLSGFTFFPQATSPYSNTFLSLPALWSGEMFTNQEPIHNYMSRALEGMNIPNALHLRGYRVDIATGTWWVDKSDKFANYYLIPTPYTGSRRRYAKTSAAFLLDLALFRQSPQPVKQCVYNGQSWFLTSLASKGTRSRYEHLAGNAFLADLAENATVEGETAMYKFIHVITPHPPLVTEPDCGFSGKVLPLTRENFTNQAACTLKSVGALLDRLKQIGVYDSSLIMIHADHGTELPFRRTDAPELFKVGSGGAEVWIGGAPFPLLLIKPVGAGGEMRVSDAQVELTDLPATVNKLVGLGVDFKGISVFDAGSGSIRSRRYFGGENDGTAVFIRDYYDYLQEVLVKGSVFDQSAWQVGARYDAPKTSKPAPYNWNTRILFDQRGDVKKYMGYGWSLPEDSWAWTDGKQASLRIPVRRPGSDVRLTANLSAYLVPEKLTRQRVRIWVNDKHISDWEIRITGFHDESAVIPEQAFDDSGQLNLKFELPDSAAPVDLEAGKDIRFLAIAVRSLQLDK